MATAEERRKILKMVEEGKITAEEGARLLAALADEQRIGPSSEPTGTGAGARWFRIRVTDTATGKQKVSVSIPLGLVSAGLKIGARFAPEVEGIRLEEVAEIIRSGTSGKIIDVLDEEEGEHVEIFVE
ncbi:MAG: DUF2089 domain-containing protein [Chloroflexi bacterium]|nr:DUF2089 domain-containing protein [Chloroflexota bacterium]